MLKNKPTGINLFFVTICLFVISFIPRLFFLLFERYDMQGLYDVNAHLFYIKYVASNLSLPLPRYCFECYQQPVYYILSALIYKIFSLSGNLNSDFLIKILQFESLVIFSFFLLFGILIIRLVSNSVNQYLIALCLFLFWPSGIIHSVRIGNDVLVYLVMSISLYFLFKWWLKEKNNLLITSVTFALFGLLVKTNAIVLIPIIVCTYIIKTFRKGGESFNKTIRFLSIMLIFFSMIMILNQRNTLLGNQQADWLMGPLSKNLDVGNNIVNYTFFDIKSYLNYPNIIPGSDSGGRQFFWNYLLKTSLFGELQPVNYTQNNLAKYISILLLVLLIFLFIRLLLLKNPANKFNIPLLLTLFFFMLSIVFVRIKDHCTGCSDFRFIYPVIIPSVLLISQSYGHGKKPFQYFYIFSVSFFVMLSFLFHLIP